MTLVDPIGDMLSRIRNGQMRSLSKIDIPYSNFRFKILEVLKKEDLNQVEEFIQKQQVYQKF